jgi:hypothetical protein
LCRLILDTRTAILELKRELYGEDDFSTQSSNRVVPRGGSVGLPATQLILQQEVQPHPRFSIPARPPSPPPKPNTITEIPQYLLKISSTLFKKATAAEIFLSRLENKRRVLNSRKKEHEMRERGMVKVCADSQTRLPREHFVQNLMSEPTTNLGNRSSRRKSIEVLMTDNLGNHANLKNDVQMEDVGGALGANVSFNQQVGEMIGNNGAIHDLNKSISKKSEIQSPAEPIEREMGVGESKSATKVSHKRAKGGKEKVEQATYWQNSDLKQNKRNSTAGENMHDLSFKSEYCL